MTRDAEPADPPVGGVPGRRIGRGDLEAVIRRAAELSVRAADAEERLSEGDLLRIGEEVGLPAKHVLQALHERPELRSDPSAFEGLFGSSVVVAHRALPGAAAATARRIESYLAAHEYLRVVRSREGAILMVPADDTLSSLARVFTRPKSRHYLARARRVAAAAHPLEEGAAHVRIEADLGEQRGKAVTAGVTIGSGMGLAAGGIGAGVIATVMDPGSAVALAGMVGSLGAGIAVGLAGGVLVAARGFKRRVRAARTELEGLLDRLERGERLEPPPAPWRQRLRSRFRGGP